MKKCANPECKRTFEPVDYRHKYCQQKCLNRHDYIKKTEAMPVISCKICGEEFKQSRSNQEKCVSCRRKDARVRTNRDTPETHPLVNVRNKFLLMPAD